MYMKKQYMQIGRSVSKRIEEAGEKLEDHARDVFLSAANQLVKDDLEPLINLVEAMADRAMDHGRDDIIQIANKITDNFEKIISQIADQVSALIDKSEKAILDIFKVATEDIKALTDNFFSDANAFLDKIDQELRTWECMTSGAGTAFLQQLKKLLPLPVMPWDACRKKLDKQMPDRHIRTTPVSELTLPVQFLLGECRALIDLKPTDAVASYCDAYEEIMELASSGRCQALFAGVDTTFFLKKIASAYSSRSALGCQSISSATTTTLVAAAKLKADPSSSATPCGPQDPIATCIINAIKAVQSAQDDLNNAMSQISSIMAGADKTTKDVAVLAAKVDSNTASIAKLSGGFSAITNIQSPKDIAFTKDSSAPFIVDYTVPAGVVPREVGISCFSFSGTIPRTSITKFRLFTKDGSSVHAWSDFSIYHYNQNSISYDNAEIWLAVPASDRNIYAELVSGPSASPNWSATCTVTQYRV
eukprot:comp21670_c0_seq1/m.48075 comp21670_c0_seq1/g.48075  ORF comp21670_c0_seq1/g.48075 comp21670_c0_seq1/m.48075 type:complete len:476 (+) comp21670_c0_seq1:35-1462(+)